MKSRSSKQGYRNSLGVPGDPLCCASYNPSSISNYFVCLPGSFIFFRLLLRSHELWPEISNAVMIFSQSHIYVSNSIPRSPLASPMPNAQFAYTVGSNINVICCTCGVPTGFWDTTKCNRLSLIGFFVCKSTNPRSLSFFQVQHLPIGRVARLEPLHFLIIYTTLQNLSLALFDGAVVSASRY